MVQQQPRQTRHIEAVAPGAAGATFDLDARRIVGRAFSPGTTPDVQQRSASVMIGP
jgi:hypothetical protein